MHEKEHKQMEENGSKKGYPVGNSEIQNSLIKLSNNLVAETEQLLRRAKSEEHLGIEVVDHITTTKTGFISSKQNNLI